MNIAILGGSFDPPHNGHLFIAREMKERYGMDEVWFIPCAIHPFQKPLTASHHRLAMLKLVENSYIKLYEYELQKKSVSYTIETLDFISKKFPKHSLTLVIGSDQIPMFQKWKKWERLIKQYPIIVYPRNRIDVSSTQIKQFIKEGKSITSLVPKRVEEYIFRNNLYANH
jgi:nicotinate-nucleotide adenylyltransferase